jgi:hypothetical protein
MLKEGRKIVYLDDAVVYDEKIQNRKFWKSTPQMAVCTITIKKDILTASKHLVLKGNIDYFDKQSIYSTAPHITFRCCDS